MKQQKIKQYVFWILLSLTAGILSGLLSRGATASFSETAIQPPLSPPASLFPVVWTILYTLMGVSAARISLVPADQKSRRALNLFIAQLIVNFFWSPIFFNARAYGFAFLWLILLWILVVTMIVSFRETDPTAANLQIPYLIWLTFAAYLNLGIWYLNR